jgi:glycosyltransferase involved in cell wall biosynthesis
MTPGAGRRVRFCTSVGGGIFGEGQTAAWQALGLDAHLDYLVSVEDYWRAKSGLLPRLRLRWLTYLTYPWQLRTKIGRAERGEIFVAVTNPFYLPALAARAARPRGLAVVHLVYDLYPDALVFGGGWRPGNPLARLAARATRAAIADCAATVYLGERLRRHAEQHYGRAPRTAVIPVGTDAARFRGCAPADREGEPVRCLYSGHLGLLHDWETLAEALQAGVPPGVAVEIAAEGPGAARLKDRLAGSARAGPGELALGGSRSAADWQRLMVGADVALVSMRPGAEKVVMPSKTYSAMAAGQAILAVCPRESDLADLVLRHDCGWIVEPGDAAALRALLAGLPGRRAELLAKRGRAWRAAHEHYSMEAVGKQWLEVFASLDAP